MTLSITIDKKATLSVRAEHCYAEYNLRVPLMLTVTNKPLMRNVAMLNLVTLSVIMLGVVAPRFWTDNQSLSTVNPF